MNNNINIDEYKPSNIEAKWYKFWEENNYFKVTEDQNKPYYTIFLPPPNVTGTLHMGHGFQHTIMDSLTRYHRMRGFNTLWQAGTDHAGIATQMVVERNLEAQGIFRKDIEREEFMQKVWEWKEYSGNMITQQMRRLGASCDWSRERFTMDDNFAQIVQNIFIKLYQEKLIYRGNKLVYWDVRRLTAVSDLEVKSVEEQGHMWYIKYLVKNSAEYIVVATTRPETMLGDVAVAVNPTDERYKHLIGEKLILPLVGRELTIIGDDYIDINFGTGCVKITPAHDFNDYAIGVKHQLNMINIMTLDGKINNNAPAKYQGLDRVEARKQIINDLIACNHLIKEEAHKLMIPRGERDDVILEPMLTNQWFMNMKQMAKRGLEIVAQKQIEFIPNNWEVIYNHWLNNIQDWCLSRQLWWGHRIPAYYDKNGQIFVANNLQEAQIIANDKNLTQDEDVLDTWFSSALWCFATLDTNISSTEINKFLPSNVLITGFDIIFFWVARMIMLTDKIVNVMPFKQVLITGLIQDANGNKMSKSKGNIIDPIDLIDGITLEKLLQKNTSHLMNPKQIKSIIATTTKNYPHGFLSYGADALRYTFLSIATYGREIRFDITRLDNARNFCNKLWNVSKFVMMNANAYKQFINTEYQITLIDQWIIQQLKQLITDIDNDYKTYRFDLITHRIYTFLWNDYCDWYVELTKVNLTLDDNSKSSAINTLIQVLETSLRIMHPIMPFITEEIWQRMKSFTVSSVNSIIIAVYPTINKLPNIINDIESIACLLQPLITNIRHLRAEMKIPLANKVPLEIEAKIEFHAQIILFQPYLMILCKLSEIKLVTTLSKHNVITAMVGQIKLMLDVTIDIDDERKRINSELTKLQIEKDKIDIKLNNAQFMAKAPQHIITQDENRKQQINTTIEHFMVQLSLLQK